MCNERILILPGVTGEDPTVLSEEMFPCEVFTGIRIWVGLPNGLFAFGCKVHQVVESTISRQIWIFGNKIILLWDIFTSIFTIFSSAINNVVFLIIRHGEIDTML